MPANPSATDVGVKLLSKGSLLSQEDRRCNAEAHALVKKAVEDCEAAH